ncbi:MAG: metallophosphoesterase [Euryarchaeota archaeon]|nr:metallophosphoesterase [Euryarchaeota archaeon]
MAGSALEMIDTDGYAPIIEFRTVLRMILNASVLMLLILACAGISSATNAASGQGAHPLDINVTFGKLIVRSEGVDRKLLDSSGGMIVSHSNSSISWTAPAIEGPYNVTVTIGDNNGGIAEDRAVITVANNYPHFLAITAPTPNTTIYTPTIIVTGTASDPSGIASVTVNDVLASGAADFCTWRADATLAIGENTITVVATDNDGCNTTETITMYRVEPFTFVHITDVHVGYTLLDISKTEAFVRSIEKFTDTLQAIKTHNPEFILSPGDLVEYSEEDFFNAYMGVSESLDIPLYNTPGNHDRRGWDPRDDIGLTTYDEIIKNPGDIKPLDDGYRDYYFDKYGYRFIGLNSGADYNVSLPPFLKSSNVSTLVSYDSWYDHSPESDGLKEIQLTRLSKMDSGMPKIIFMHHPAISDSDDESVTGSSELPVTNTCPLEYGGNDACIAFNRCKFIDYCINNTADLVLTGHTHRDYVKTVFNEMETHKTWFIQTRSATKDPDPYNYHGYRVIEITDEGVVPHISEMTEETLKNSERYTYSAQSNPLDRIRIYAYVISGLNITGSLPDGITKRDIPDSYSTGVLDKLPQIIRCYNEMPDKFKFGLKLLPADTPNTTTQRAIEEEPAHLTIIMKHQSENMTVEYIYEDITLSASENATAVVDLDSANANYTMGIDYDGDGTTDNTTEPTRIILNHAPNVSITTPIGKQGGNVTISYNLKDVESDECTTIAQYSLDNTTWLYAGVSEGGDGMTNVASSPAGIDHTFVWASGTDILHTNATVHFRIGLFDDELASEYATTDAFSVDNRVRGDLNNDGTLTPADAAIALRIAVRGDRDHIADVNGDGHVTSLDSLIMLQASTKTIKF